MEAGTIGDDIDLHVLVPGAIIFDHMAGVVQREVHDLRIVLVDLDGDAMRFALGEGCGSERYRHQGHGRTTVKKAAPIIKSPQGFRHCEEPTGECAPDDRLRGEAIHSPSFRDGPKDQTRNLELPGSMLCIAPE